MTAAVHDRLSGTPLSGSRVRGGGPALRALVRWAWRLFRREWRQQLLVLALVAVAVAATTAGIAATTNFAKPPETRVTLPASDPTLTADIAALEGAFGSAEVVEHREVRIPGSVAAFDLRAEDTTGVRVHPRLRLVSGRFPSAPDEVALTRDVAAVFGVGAGDTWDGSGSTLRVVGLVENPRDLSDRFALVVPGQVGDTGTVTLLFDGAHSMRDVRVPTGSPVGIEIQGAAARDAIAAAVLAMASVGLLFIGLLAVAGFTVMAQRRQRALGMLAAIGATARHVRLVMLANGAVVGATAAVVGAVAGVGGWLALAPRLEAVAGHRIDRF